MKASVAIFVPHMSFAHSSPHRHNDRSHIRRIDLHHLTPGLTCLSYSRRRLSSPSLSASTRIRSIPGGNVIWRSQVFLRNYRGANSSEINSTEVKSKYPGPVVASRYASQVPQHEQVVHTLDKSRFTTIHNGFDGFTTTPRQINHKSNKS